MKEIKGEEVNQRIFELIQQQNGNCGLVWSEEDKEEFANLIVQECVDILPEKVEIADLYDGRILVQCGKAIKEHFGVEE